MQAGHRHPCKGMARLLARLKADRKGGVLITMGFAVIPLTFAVGFGIDYARAMRIETQLNAAADAAALAAVDPAMILQSDAASSAAATNMFNSQAVLVSGFRNLNMTPTIVDSVSGGTGSLGYLRKATVTYTAQSINMFGKILGAPTLTISGTSSASAEQPPNVDFYLAMDDSPSMLIPSTSDGITKVQAVTTCAFACHEQMPHNEPSPIKPVTNASNYQVLLSTAYYTSGSPQQGVYYLYDPVASVLYDSNQHGMNQGNKTYSITDSSSGPVTITQTKTTGHSSTSTTYDTGFWADGYWLTHNYGLAFGSPASISLRKDDVVSAATQLIPYAATQASTYQVTYQAQMFSFDWTRSGGSSPVKTLNNLTNVAAYGSGFSAASLFPPDDYWWQNSMPSSSTNNNDQGSEITNMLTTMNGIIPNPGSGAPGATPQKILFIVTDGMADQPSGGGRYFGPLRSSDLSTCSAIKARGIKIAILYTQYLPQALSGDSWSQSNVAPFLPAPPSPYPVGNAGSSDQVLTALQTCASPGNNGSPLVQAVTADANITTALQQLFSTALQSARLVR